MPNSQLPRMNKNGSPYSYYLAPNAVVNPGSEGLVFETLFQLPPYALYNGIEAGKTPNPIQHPQVFANLAVPVAGIGGLQAGQLFTLPLALQTEDNDNG